MPETPSEQPTSADDIVTAALVEVRGLLVAHEYDRAGVAELLGEDALQALEEQDPSAARRALRPALFPQLNGNLTEAWVPLLPRAVLIALFLIRVPVSAGHLRAALGADTLNRLRDAGLIAEATAEEIRAATGASSAVTDAPPGAARTSPAGTAETAAEVSPGSPDMEASPATAGAGADGASETEEHFVGAFRIVPEVLPAAVRSALSAVAPAGNADGPPAWEAPAPAGPHDLLIASDWDTGTRPGRLPADHVLGVGRATRTLAEITEREPVGTLLDLGTGCGYHALLATWHAEQVIGTDVSDRALRFARWNLLLNEGRLPHTRIEFREGSMFDPLDGPVDQIVSNPPFVITPRGTGRAVYEYRDAGRTGDEIVAAILRGAGARLTPGGTAQLLANWEYRDEQRTSRRPGETSAAEPDERPARQPEQEAGDERTQDAAPALAMLAQAEVPTHGLIVEREVLSPLRYAQTWIRDAGEERGSASWQRALDDWLDDFAARGVTGIGLGWVLLQRPDEEAERAVHRAERVTTPAPQDGTLGVQLAARLRAGIWLEGMSQDELMGLRLRVADDVTDERHFWPGRGEPSALLLRQGGGIGATVPSDTALSGLVGASDGELTVGQLATALAGLLDVDARDLSDQLDGQVRRLIALGLLRLER
ncbi:DUF7059 domain-containing protein [Sediminivirga luteola]|uniref:Methyltransferase n=1 Tax=Sediminivirga luteola TaxID=1774748 RepID=A0A8J2XIB4_9MICO|nr:methyltransferase [Sediminivirga luteola]GGA01641.1 methyltransferase [Sediminivirga luteola]